MTQRLIGIRRTGCAGARRRSRRCGDRLARCRSWFFARLTAAPAVRWMRSLLNVNANTAKRALLRAGLGQSEVPPRAKDQAHGRERRRTAAKSPRRAVSWRCRDFALEEMEWPSKSASTGSRRIGRDMLRAASATRTSTIVAVTNHQHGRPVAPAQVRLDPRRPDGDIVRDRDQRHGQRRQSSRCCRRDRPGAAAVEGPRRRGRRRVDRHLHDRDKAAQHLGRVRRTGDHQHRRRTPT